ncbi:MAG TPA: sulfurtransferase, partial [Alphaproteobacteria bacterium]|nr:sulfurtransferase [Alphaproteobacteria bacterium]
MKKFFAMALALALVTAAGAVKAATPLVDVAWVKANLGKPGVVFLDVGGKLGGKTKADFLRGHIPGAVWTNYLKDGWRYKDKNNTVGQLSPTPKLEKLIGGLGIGNNDHVVIIPVGGKALDVATATRIYWTFKVLGHDNVSVLNGGMNAYKKAKNPLAKGSAKPKAKTFKAAFRKDMVIAKADVV